MYDYWPWHNLTPIKFSDIHNLIPFVADDDYNTTYQILTYEAETVILVYTSVM